MTQEALVTPQEVDLYSPLDPSALPNDPVLLKQMLVQLLALLRKETRRREDVERNMDLLLRKLTSARSEPCSADQLQLFETMAGEISSPVQNDPAATPGTEPEPKKKCRPHGRRRPPAHLMEVEVVHDLPEDLKRELGEANLVPLPDVVTHQYDYQAAKFVVLRHVQKKYLRRESDVHISPDGSLAMPTPNDASAVNTTAPAETTPTSSETAPIDMPKATNAGVLHGVEEKILLAEKPKVPECEAAPGLLAYIWLSKYGDHLPLYRLETITERYGIVFTRSTTCGWMMQLAGCGRCGGGYATKYVFRE